MKNLRVAALASDSLTMDAMSRHVRSDDGLVLTDAASRQADVVLVAGFRVSANMVDFLREANERFEAPIVLVVSDISLLELLIAVDFGVAAVVPRRSATRDRILREMRTVAGGGSSLPPKLVTGVLKHLRVLRAEVDDQRSHDPLYGLTAREMAVLQLLAEGMDTTDIASELRYSERTVKAIIQDVIHRLGVRNRAQAVAYAVRGGVI